MIDAALKYLKSGLSIIPTDPKTKVPARMAGRWKQYQTKAASESQVREWFGNGHNHSIALICGEVSGNVEVLDFDQKGDRYEAFMQLLPADLKSKLVIERSQNGGYHIAFRCDVPVMGNRKLAERGVKVNGPGDHEYHGKKYRAQKHGDGWYIVIDLIETRGEGGYFLCAPSAGYTLVQGKISALPLLSEAELDLLESTAKALNEWVMPRMASVRNDQSAPSGKTPWHDFSEKTNPLEILEAHGWKVLNSSGRTPAGGHTVLVRRPGKHEGHSGSVIDDRVFYNWSSSAYPFEVEKAYSAFQVFALLNHGGDFKKAASDLSRQGFGDKTTPPEKPKKSYMCTDIGNGERFADQWRNVAIYCKPWGKWFFWNGVKWNEDESGEAIERAKKTVRSIYEEARACDNDDKREAIAKWGLKSESRTRIEAMVSLAQSEAGIPVLPMELDRDNWLLNCPNGTLNLKNGDFVQNEPLDRITKVCGPLVNHQAQCPTWIKFLNQIFSGKQDLIEFVQRAFGYSLTGDDSEHCLFFLYGTGRNGKSTLLEVLAALLGDYARHSSFETFIEKKSESVRNDIADLRGARVVVASEAEKGQRLAESLIKNMTGGELMKARFLYAEYFEFRPTFKIWLAANHKPIIRGTDPAIWARIRLIPFEVRIPDDKIDRQLKEKLLGELPGIFNWAVDGCIEWRDKGLSTCDAVMCATSDYRLEMDVLGSFIEDCCIIGTSMSVPKASIYQAYEKWAEENGEKAMSKRAFGMCLMERGYLEDRQSIARSWRGIGLRY